MSDPKNGLAVLLRNSLGADWQHLHPDIRARFTLAQGETRQTFTGTMGEINRSALGWLIAKLIAFVRILPATRARNVPFEFNLAPALNGGWIKERLYRFQEGCFQFRSVMSIAANGDLIEQFPYGLGMKIKLGAGDEKLYFRDDGYFLRIGALKLPLPRWLTVGRFTLTHRSIDREHFTVEISLDHPLFGRLFYQYGAFTQSAASNRMTLAGTTGSPPSARSSLPFPVAGKFRPH
jgi:hypothetical protein